MKRDPVRDAIAIAVLAIESHLVGIVGDTPVQRGDLIGSTPESFFPAAVEVKAHFSRAERESRGGPAAQTWEILEHARFADSLAGDTEREDRGHDGGPTRNP